MGQKMKSLETPGSVNALKLADINFRSPSSGATWIFLLCAVTVQKRLNPTDNKLCPTV